ncbi:MAG: ribbon-helix-helix protein, CopG family [Clostridia bacterium]|nr:ribbon-helix-helix protein, CopG family [Clostridia bacterium]
MAECKRIMVTVPDSLLNDVDCLAKCDGISRNEMIREAVSEYITGRKNRNLREQLKNGYEEMAAINIEWAENCLEADNECQLGYEEKLSECE